MLRGKSTEVQFFAGCQGYPLQTFTPSQKKHVQLVDMSVHCIVEVLSIQVVLDVAGFVALHQIWCQSTLKAVLVGHQSRFLRASHHQLHWSVLMLFGTKVHACF